MRTAVLILGGAVIGFASFMYWRDFWGTSLTIIIGCLAWFAIVRAWDPAWKR